MQSRQVKRTIARSEQKLEGRPKIYLSIPKEFLDIMDNPWSTIQGNVLTPMTLPEVLMFTVRRAPVKSGDDAIRTLACFQAIKDTPNGVIEMAKDDWDWMLAHFREVAHTVWLPPDSAYLVRWLEENVKASKVLAPSVGLAP